MTIATLKVPLLCCQTVKHLLPRLTKLFLTPPLLSALILLLGLSCTERSRPELSLGKPAFKNFDPEFVEKLTWSSLQTGTNPFDLELTKTSPDKWEFSKSPTLILDREANHNFIKHWLETLKTLTPRQYVEASEQSRVGLDPPESVFHFFNPKYEMSIYLGEKTKLPGANSLQGRFAAFQDPKDKPVLVKVDGAFLRMLDLIQDWSKLRRAKVFARDLDDVDAFDFGGGLMIERNGVQWQIQGQKPMKEEPLHGLFTKLFNQQIRNHIDSKDLSQELEDLCKDPKSTQSIAMEYLDQKKEKVIFCTKAFTVPAIPKDSAKQLPSPTLYARSSDKSTYWEVYPEALQTLESIKNTINTASAKRR